MALTARQQQTKDEFIAVRGTWSDSWERILELDAEFVRAYLAWSAVPLRKHHLEPKVREFIFIAEPGACRSRPPGWPLPSSAASPSTR